MAASKNLNRNYIGHEISNEWEYNYKTILNAARLDMLCEAAKIEQKDTTIESSGVQEAKL